jgi:hypothetical protein
LIKVAGKRDGLGLLELCGQNRCAGMNSSRHIVVGRTAHACSAAAQAAEGLGKKDVLRNVETDPPTIEIHHGLLVIDA